MKMSYPFKFSRDFPTYVFFYESYYCELEEYAFQNKDRFGEDPDYDVVREELVNLKNEAFIEPLSIEVDYINRYLDFYEISMCEDNLPGLGCDYILQVVPKAEPTAYQTPAAMEKETEKITTWLRTYPHEYGFVCIRDPVTERYKAERRGLYNLRPGTPKKAGRRSRHGIKRR